VCFTQNSRLYATFQFPNIDLRVVMNKITPTLIALIATFVTGCGAEIAYKQGASARDLQANKAACQQAVDEAAFNQCLEDNGWAVQKLGEKWLSDDDLFATASVSDNKQVTAKPTKPSTLQTTDNMTADSIENEASTNKTPTTTAKPESIAVKSDIKPTVKPAEPVIRQAITTAEPTEKTALNNADKSVMTEPTAKPQQHIFDTYEIKSWWKMGGNATQLEKNMDECSATLGEAHQPNKVTFTFTRGFAICMREKGWRGLISQNK
jgi:hypothetical protein